ncbi:hypothetical protein [Viridibacillus arvi]|uniref:hypothetical protein n=1 Tax=Viridibacillus arvi TaxID=263475 RepID=UPI00187B6BD8|nr:hypothetical protein [Viridibacillus sp. JNUCC-6]QOV11627.1 hypothetical protein JNUCC6_02260 [Viridibacillus sp. JNUCC-6]
MLDIDYLEDEAFESVEEVVSQFIVKIGDQKINIRITKDAHGHFQFVNSHYYQGSKQADSYIAYVTNFPSEKIAIMNAKLQIVGSYDPTDKNGVWIENNSFN